MINLGKGDNNILKKKVYGKPMIMLFSYWMKANDDVAFILNDSQCIFFKRNSILKWKLMFIASIIEWEPMTCCLLSLMNESHCYVAFIVGWKLMFVASIIEWKLMIYCLLPLMNESHCYVTFIIGWKSMFVVSIVE